jgi:hypothetical protein
MYGMKQMLMYYWTYIPHDNSSGKYVRLVLVKFFIKLKEDNDTPTYFQDSATAHTVDDSLMALEEVFGDRIISCNLWPACWPDLTPCNLNLPGNLKNKIYRRSTHIIEEFKENI